MSLKNLFGKEDEKKAGTACGSGGKK